MVVCHWLDIRQFFCLSVGELNKNALRKHLLSLNLSSQRLPSKKISLITKVLKNFSVYNLSRRLPFILMVQNAFLTRFPEYEVTVVPVKLRKNLITIKLFE